MYNNIYLLYKISSTDMTDYLSILEKKRGWALIDWKS